MLFWILSGAVALVVAAGLAWSVVTGKRETGPAEAYDLQVYRDQLAEVDSDAARGKIDAAEAERLRIEISRRLLAADAKVRTDSGTGSQPQGLSRGAAVMSTLILLGGGFGLYTLLGAPGYRDQPLQMRLTQAQKTLHDRPPQAEVEARVAASMPASSPEATAEYLELVKKLRDAVAKRPDDLQGQTLLARSEGALGNFKASHEALQAIIRIKGDAATAKDYADLADMMVLAAGGYVSPEAQKAIEAALTLDRTNGVARFYGGLMMAQTGRPDIGFRMWNALMMDSQPDDPWMEPLRAQIEEMAIRAGESKFRLPPIMNPGGLKGPTAGDVAAAQDMTDADRQDMIRGMVGQLSERLATEGGTPEEWARLISSLGVLGDTDKAKEIYAEAQGVFAANEAALAVVKAAAERAGVAQ